MSSNLLTTPTAGGLEGQILRAALGEIVRRGYARTRTVDIAHRAGTSEPTVFRVVGKKEKLLRRVYDESWSAINEELMLQAREDAQPRSSYREMLVAEVGRVLGMWNKATELRPALHIAFLYLRRPGELMEPDGERFSSDAYESFRAHVQRLAEGAIQEEGSSRSAQLVTTMMINLIATVILTWATEQDPDFPLGEAVLAASSLLGDLLTEAGA